MEIKVLGSGCKSCNILYDNTVKVVNDNHIEANVIKLTDVKEMMVYDVMSFPALVINEVVVSQGKQLKSENILSLIKSNI